MDDVKRWNSAVIINLVVYTLTRSASGKVHFVVLHTSDENGMMADSFKRVTYHHESKCDNNRNASSRWIYTRLESGFQGILLPLLFKVVPFLTSVYDPHSMRRGPQILIIFSSVPYALLSKLRAQTQNVSSVLPPLNSFPSETKHVNHKNYQQRRINHLYMSTPSELPPPEWVAANWFCIVIRRQSEL